MGGRLIHGIDLYTGKYGTYKITLKKRPFEALISDHPGNLQEWSQQELVEPILVTDQNCKQ